MIWSQYDAREMFERLLRQDAEIVKLRAERDAAERRLDEIGRSNSDMCDRIYELEQELAVERGEVRTREAIVEMNAEYDR